MKKIKFFSCLFILAALVGCNNANATRDIGDINDIDAGIVTPTSFILTIEAVNGMVEGSDEAFAYGETATLVATPDYGYDFIAWQLNGAVLSEDTALSHKVIANQTITAVFLPKAVTYVFVEDNGTTYLSSDFFTNPIDIIGRLPFNVIGKIVEGWATPVLDGNRFVVNAVYSADLSLLRTVVIDGVSREVHYGEEIIAHATNPDFTHWRDFNGNIISYNREYKFNAVSNMNIRQSNQLLGATATIPTVSLNSVDFTAGVLTCELTLAVDGLTAGSTLEDYGISEIGVVLSNNSGFTSTNGLVKYAAQSINSNGQFNIVISNVPTDELCIYAKGYVKYLDLQDNIIEKITQTNEKVVEVSVPSGPVYDVEFTFVSTRIYNSWYIEFVFASGFLNSFAQANFTLKYTISGSSTSVTTKITEWLYGTTVRLMPTSENTSTNPTTNAWSGSLTATNNSSKIYYAEISSAAGATTLTKKSLPAPFMPIQNTAKASIDTHRNTFDDLYYSNDAVDLLNEITINFKAAVDAAVSVTEVNNIVNAAKKAMNDIPMDLTNAKALACQELNTYATNKGEENYSVQNWNELSGYLQSGILAIEGAVSPGDITSALTIAKNAIDGILLDNNPLYVARYNACNELSDYVSGKDQSKYSPANWNKILGLVETWSTTINTTDIIADISNVVASAKLAIDAIKELPKYLELTISTFNGYGTNYVTITFSTVISTPSAISKDDSYIETSTGVTGRVETIIIHATGELGYINFNFTGAQNYTGLLTVTLICTDGRMYQGSKTK